MAIDQAQKRGLTNFSALVSHVLTPPAITAILQDPSHRVDAFLGPGHVCSVMGTREYDPIAARYRVPIVITGFEPLDLLEGVWRAVERLRRGAHGVDNQYGPRGERARQRRVASAARTRVRGLRLESGAASGYLPKSGLRLRYEYRAPTTRCVCSKSTTFELRSPPNASAGRCCAA